MGRVGASATSETGAPAAIAGRMADERTLALTFDRMLAGAGDALALTDDNFGVNGQSGGVAEAYAEGREVFVVLEETATGDYVDVSVAANTVFGAGIVAGSGNAAVASYRIVTESGALKLKNELDPEGSGFELADAMAYMNRLKAAEGDANIAGHGGLDGTDVRFLLSLLDLGLPDRTQLQAAIAQADALLAATQGRTDAERNQLSVSREQALAVAAAASSTQRVLDAARVRIEASLAAFKPVGAKYRTVRAPQSVGLTPGSLLADGVFSEADRQQLGTDEGAAGASLRVVLPAADGGFDDYRPGDEIVLTVGASEGSEYDYTLKASDVARMKKTGEAASFDIDIRSFLNEQGTDLAAIGYSTFVRNGANASQSSAAVGSTAEEAFGIDVAPLILTAPERVVQGEPIAVTANDPQAKVYLTQRGMATDLGFACSVGDGCSLATSLLEAGSYEIYATDASGQKSASRTVEVEILPVAPAAPVSVALNWEVPINEEGQFVLNRPARDALGWSEEPVMAEVVLQGNRDADPDYAIGDRIVVEFRGGERNYKSVIHALNSDDIDALNDVGAEQTVTVSVDVTSYFLGEEDPLDDTVEVTVYAQDAEDETLVSASVAMEHTIWIDLTMPALKVSTGDVIGQPPAETIALESGRIVARSEEHAIIYVFPWALVEYIRTEDQLEELVGRGEAYKQTYAGSNVTFQAAWLGINLFGVVAVDEAGNLSWPEGTISVFDSAAPTLDDVKTVESGELAETISLEEGRIWASSSEAGTIYAVLESELPESVTASDLDQLITLEKGLKRAYVAGHVLFHASELGEGGYVLYAVDKAGKLSAPSDTIRVEDQLAPVVEVRTSEYGNTIPLDGGRIWARSTEAGTIFAIPAGEASSEMTLEALNAVVSDEIGYSRPFVKADVVFEAADLGDGEFVFYAVDEALKVSAPSKTIFIDEFYVPDVEAPTLDVTTSEDGEGGPAEEIPWQTGSIYAQSNESGMIYIVPANDDVASEVSVHELEAIISDERGLRRETSESDVTFEAMDLSAGNYILFAVDESGNVSAASRPISIFYVEPPLYLAEDAPDSVEIDDEGTIHLPIGLTAGDLRMYLQSVEDFNIYEEDSYEPSTLEDTDLLTEENVVVAWSQSVKFVYYLDFHPYVVESAYHDEEADYSPAYLTVDAPLKIRFSERLTEYASSQVEEAFIDAVEDREFDFEWVPGEGEEILTIGLVPLEEGAGEDPGVYFVHSVTAKLIEAPSGDPELLLEADPLDMMISPVVEGRITLSFEADLSLRLLQAESFDPAIIEEILVMDGNEQVGALEVMSIEHGLADNELVAIVSNWDELGTENNGFLSLKVKFKPRSIDSVLGNWLSDGYYLYLPLPPV
ncbi:hypothetical protein [Paenibacillus methanolicus]|uniref:Uncharacterized protein n=1 Tax=Paenibacillus methanolicus TaxID=582686 RepID=A0A5S5BQD9_9BACL|nr:hypothetical protein [Paenibacillus methanolicus]TYP69415.1 hypothetical protein BCM02_11575 [Paenibacillus methanolicus]